MYRRDNSLSRERGSRNLFEKLGHGQHGLVDHRCAICTPDSSSSRPWNSFSWANCPADSRSPRFPLISNRPGSDDIREVNPIRSAQIRRSSRLPAPFTPRRVSKYHLPRSDAVHGQFERDRCLSERQYRKEYVIYCRLCLTISFVSFIL